MARRPKPKKQVRYRVLKPCFVGGRRVDPRDEKFIVADAGLEGSALKAVADEPGEQADAPNDGDGGGEDPSNGDGGESAGGETPPAA